MFRFAVILLLFAALPLSALTILDGSADGVMPVRRQAMMLALENKWKLSVKSSSALEAIRDLREGRADAVVLEKSDIPAEIPFEKHVFSQRAAAVYVNVNNTCTGLTRQEICELLASPRPSWRSITGNKVDIHLYGLSDKAQGYGLFSRLLLKNDFQIKSPVFRTSSTNNVIQLCAGNPVAMGFALFSPKGSEMVRPLAIDGVAPSFENLGSGKYPLTVTYVLLTPAEMKPEVRKLLESFKTPRFLELLEAAEMLPR